MAARFKISCRNKLESRLKTLPDTMRVSGQTSSIADFAKQHLRELSLTDYQEVYEAPLPVSRQTAWSQLNPTIQTPVSNHPSKDPCTPKHPCNQTTDIFRKLRVKLRERKESDSSELRIQKREGQLKKSIWQSRKGTVQEVNIDFYGAGDSRIHSKTITNGFKSEIIGERKICLSRSLLSQTYSKRERQVNALRRKSVMGVVTASKGDKKRNKNYHPISIHLMKEYLQLAKAIRAERISS